MLYKLSHPVQKIVAITATFVVVAGTAISAYAAAPPGSGAAIEGARPPAAVQPPVAKGPVITVEGQQPAAVEDGGPKILVKAFRLSGESPLPADELLDLVQGEAGKDMS